MEELPETLKAEIEALDSLDARALKRRYADIVADMPKCALSSVLRATIVYRLQERHYGLSLSKEATAWLDEAADDKRMFPNGRKVGSGARFVRFWKGERYETTVRDDGHMAADCDGVHDLVLDGQLKLVDDRGVDLFGFRHRPADFGELVVFVARRHSDPVRLRRLRNARIIRW